MAKRRKGRAVNGIFLLNKPLGGSSNQVMQQVRWLFGAAKAGHTGALDPLATGMLPICLGEATKFSQFLLDADKTYRVTAKLGIRTSTSDADGEVVETRPVNVTEAQVHQAVMGFKGKSKQVPSMFSALKYQGKPLYYYARQGIEVPREARDIEIFDIQISRFDKDEVDMQVHCSKGTYIRSLVDDLGQLLGCGAYVTMLDRVQVANYPVDNMMGLDELQALAEECRDGESVNYQALDALLLPMDTAVAALPAVRVKTEKLAYFSNGNPVQADTADLTGQVRAYAEEDGRFLGVAEVEQPGRLAPRRLVVY
ncbi:tRNA pseudouridine(55) synthase TruB [Bowmanella denitrificans]|uniref:tRNA pseudouridine synthase B n=1 Tax=Bowmanella denitrificans TaxID=366582 RepID=A0ABN0X5Q6_9ALTE|nr:tRNA pseudouridine(55) synthase TruB [Bowmanella denitrificans]